MPFFIIAGAVNAAIAVILGAFGAHALKEKLSETLFSHMGNSRSISNVPRNRIDCHRNTYELFTSRTDLRNSIGPVTYFLQESLSSRVACTF